MYSWTTISGRTVSLSTVNRVTFFVAVEGIEIARGSVETVDDSGFWAPVREKGICGVIGGFGVTDLARWESIKAWVAAGAP